MARTRYQYGTIVVQKGKAHSTYFGRWMEDYCEAGGFVTRRKRSVVLGRVGEITEKQAKRKFESILARINDPGYLPQQSITFQALAQEWQDQAFQEMKPSTVVNMQGHLTNHLLPFFGEKPVREISTRDIDTFFSGLDVGKKTKKNIFGTLKLVLKQGRAWGNIKENVWESAKRIGKSEGSEIIAFSDSEVEDILRRSQNPQRLFYWLAVEGGLRKGELEGLRVGDVDHAKRLLRIRQTIWRGRVQKPKTVNSIRDVPLPAEILAELKVHVGDRKDGLVFQTKNGTPWNADLLLKRHMRKKLGIVKGNLHTFRHTFATRQLNAGVPIAVVSKLLGHGSITTTLNIYAHVLAEHMQQFEERRAHVLGVGKAVKKPENAVELDSKQTVVDKSDCQESLSPVVSMTRGGAAW